MSDKQKTAMEILSEWADEYYEIHKSAPKLSELKNKATELKETTEKSQIVEGFDRGHINGWVEGANGITEQKVRGTDYYTKTYSK